VVDGNPRLLTSQSRHDDRADRLAAATDTIHDVLIVGGGINGARLFDLMGRQGVSALLLDAADYAAGTSQATGMMVWGGLLYLRQLDLGTVFKLCRARDRLLAELPDRAVPRRLRYFPGAQSRPSVLLVGLVFYWLLGGCKRQVPRLERDYPELALLSETAPSLTYEEGTLVGADCRFVLDWLFRRASPRHLAINYCGLEGANYDRTNKLWRVRARDQRAGREIEIRARQIVNCAGVWTDQVNARCGIRSPIKHAFSKGVYAAFPRPEGHDLPLIFEMGANDDVITSVPFGPVALWGPTETLITDLTDGFHAQADDLRFLLAHRRRCFRVPGGPQDIISFRAGVRPLAVPADFDDDVYPLKLSRRRQIMADPLLPFLAVYGGKFTDSAECAEAVWARIAPRLPPARLPPPPATQPDASAFVEFPGLASLVPDPEWSRAHEHCHTLDDYLRRRTNIAQWVPRGGLGHNNENIARLRDIAITLAGGDEASAMADFTHYRDRLDIEFDRVVQAV
jgi:glycerol-3-phosphate dehydrogenase